MLLRAQPTDRGILAATLALAVAAALALTSGYIETAGRLLSDADQRGLALYFLIEAARTLPLFAR